ncbi:MAG: lysophospholipid acyltransferase family protein [Bacteroidales bacterium]|nr:lysophospholipid acyltransferase family protein [Bacteroidales bacterium]
MQLLLFYIVYSFCWLIALLPLRILYILSNFLYVILYYILRYRRKVVNENLRNSFPEKSPEEIKSIAKKFYRHLADLFMEIIKMINFNLESLSKHVKYTNPGVLDDLYKQGKDVAVALGHYGNWEWQQGLSAYHKHLPLIIYKPISNKYFERVFYNMRKKMNVVPIQMRRIIRAILRYRKQGILTITAFVSDQSTIWEETQYWTTFLGQDTPVYLGIEKIAMKTKQAVIFYKCSKPRRGYYEVEILKLFDDASKTKPYEITQKHTEILEEIIREKPELWLWTHRRWKLKNRKAQEHEQKN